MKPKQRQKKLERRRAAHARLKSELSDTKPRQRLESGGYRCPGSNK